MFALDPQSGTPIYRQLMEQIRRLISSGQMRQGDELPSVRELAMTHAVNPMTISKAYSLLEAEGLLCRERGKSMRVSRDSTLKENRRERLARLQPAIDQLTMAAQQLELEPTEVLNALKEALEKNHD